MRATRFLSADGLAFSLAALATIALVPRAMGVHARYGFGLVLRVLIAGVGIAAILEGALLLAPTTGRPRSVQALVLSALAPVCLAVFAAFGWARTDGVTFSLDWTAYASEPAVAVFLVTAALAMLRLHVPGEETNSAIARPFALAGAVAGIATAVVYALFRTVLRSTELRLAVVFLGVLISAQLFLAAALIGIRGRRESVWDRGLAAVSAVFVVAACVLVLGMDG